MTIVPGDLAELSVQREPIPDGCGGVESGIAIRVFVYVDEPGDVELALTVLIPDGPEGRGVGSWYAQAREIINTALAIFEL